MSDVDNNNETNGVGGLESGCNDVSIAPAAVVALGHCAAGRQRSASTCCTTVVVTLRTEFRTPRGAASQVAQVAKALLEHAARQVRTARCRVLIMRVNKLKRGWGYRGSSQG